MSLLKKLKALAFEEEAVTVTAEVAEVANTQPEVAKPVVPASSEIVEQMYKQFIERMESPETDCGVFHTFDDTLDSLESIIPDESQRYKAALASSAKSFGLEALIGSFPKCLIIMDEINAAFSQQLNQEKERSEELIGQKDAINVTIADMEAQITTLHERLKLEQEDLFNINKEMDAEEIRVNTLESTFKVVDARVRNDYQTEFTKIETYLGKGEVAA